MINQSYNSIHLSLWAMGEMGEGVTQSIKCFLHKLENLNWDFSTTVYSECLCNPVLG